MTAAGPAARAAPDAPSAAADAARALSRAGDHAGALALLDAALAGQPRHRGLRMDRAAALRELDRIAEAEAAYAAVLAERPGFAPALVGLGHCARRRGDPEAALSRFREAAEADTANAWAPTEAGHLLREMGRFEEAEAAYADASVRRPDLVPARIGLGHCARRRGDRAAARAHFEAAARLNPANLAARLEAATEARELGELDAARAAAEAVIAEAPGHAPAWMNLGLTERRADRRAAARDAFAAVAARQPAAARPLVEQAAECLALGEAAAAEALLRRAMALDPAAAAPVGALAEQARVAGRLEEALALGREAVARDPAGLPARLSVAQTLFDMGRFEESEAELDAAAPALGGERPAIAARRAALRRRSGDLPGALALARAVHAAAPGEFPLWHARAQLEVLLERDAGALEACLAAAPAGRAAERALVEVCRGDAAELRNAPDAARRHMEAALRLNPAQPHPHHVLARLALRRWDTDAVREHLAAALRLEAGQVALQGRRNRVSQSLMGQILDDVLVDRPLVEALVALQDRPPAARLAPVAGLVRAHPDATAPALALLGALRAIGPLRGRPFAGDAPRAIPAAIGQYWDAAEPPADVLALMEGWRAAHPGHAVHRFSDRTALAFLDAACAPPVRQAFLRAAEPAMRADLVRLAWLGAHGGLWVDADDRCLGPVGAVVPSGTVLFGYQEDVGTLGNNLLAAAPGHRVILRALDRAVEAVNRGDEDLVWLSTGPGLLTRALAEVAARAAAPGAAPALPPGTVILDRLELGGVAAMHVSAGYKAARRGHWMRTFHRRRGGGDPRPASPPG